MCNRLEKITFLTFLHLSYFYKTTNHLLLKVQFSKILIKYAHIYEILKKYRKHFYGNSFLQAAHIQQRLH